MKRYLSLIAFGDALEILERSFPDPCRTEVIPVTESLGRIVASPLCATYSVPEANLAAMDGYAVHTRDTLGANDQAPLILKDFVQVNTGNIVPPGFDAVIMFEDTWVSGDSVEIRRPAITGQHIRVAGEDIRKGQLILPAGHQVRAFDIGALVTYGIRELVVKTARVGLIPTGSEIVPLGARPLPGQVVESNTIMGQVYLQQMGARCTRYPIVPDEPDLIATTLSNAVRENDLVLISAGSSAGTRDYTAGVISSLGELVFHGVAVRPGKPVMLGIVDGKPVLGLPGYPLAAQTVIREFAGRLLETWGLVSPSPTMVPIRFAHPLVSDIGFDEFIPVSIGRVNGHYWAFPHSRSSAVQMAPVRANGYVHVSSMVEGLPACHAIDAVVTTDISSIEKTVLLSGWFDPAILTMADFIRKGGLVIHAANTGNTLGLVTLRNGGCHGAPVNVPEFAMLPHYRILSGLLPPSGLIFLHIASIPQGIVSKSGITPDDLPGYRFVNRLKGSPARTVFDTLLQARGIPPGSINGYHYEVQSPEAVIEAVQSGWADAGICSRDIADAAGLSFSPVMDEQYELALLPDSLGEPVVHALISVVQDPGFKASLGETGKYDTRRTGMMYAVSKDLEVHEYFPDHANNTP